MKGPVRCEIDWAIHVDEIYACANVEELTKLVESRRKEAVEELGKLQRLCDVEGRAPG